MIEPVETFTHAGVTVEIVPDDDPGYGPQENDNAGTIYSWTRDFDGDKSIYQSDTISGRPYELADAMWEKTGTQATRKFNAYFRENYDSALTIPLRFDDYGSYGARLHYDTFAENANAAICFTRDEITTEWDRSFAGAKRYAKARVNELDEWFQGYVYGIIIRDPATNEAVESVWGFIGDLYGKTGEYIYEEACEMADGVADAIRRENNEAAYWSARDVVTI